MTKPQAAATASSLPRLVLVAGLAIAIGGAILSSTKAVVAKLLYRYHIDAVTLIAFRMMFSLPVLDRPGNGVHRADFPAAPGLLVQPMPVYRRSPASGIFCTIFLS